MAEPNWARVLEILHNEEVSRIELPIQGSNAPDPNHPIVENSDLNSEELNSAISYLSDSGLIEQPMGTSYYRLTERGFTVAHERELRKREDEREERRVRQQTNVNRVLGGLTLGLLLVNAMSLFATGLLEAPNQMFWGIPPEIIVIGLGGLAAFVVFRMAHTISEAKILEVEK